MLLDTSIALARVRLPCDTCVSLMVRVSRLRHRHDPLPSSPYTSSVLSTRWSDNSAAAVKSFGSRARLKGVREERGPIADQIVIDPAA